MLTIRLKFVSTICAIATLAGCSEAEKTFHANEPEVDQQLRDFAGRFTIPGYDRVDVIEWTPPRARLVYNFRSIDPKGDTCADLIHALEALPGWRLQTPRGTTRGPCTYNGNADRYFITSGVSEEKPGLIVVGFWPPERGL